MPPGKQGLGKDSDRTQPMGSLSPVPFLNRSRMLHADALTVHRSSVLVRTSRIPQKLSVRTCARYWPPGVTVQGAALVLAEAMAGSVLAPAARASAPAASMTVLMRACMGTSEVRGGWRITGASGPTGDRSGELPVDLGCALLLQQLAGAAERARPEEPAVGGVGAGMGGLDQRDAVEQRREAAR